MVTLGVATVVETGEAGAAVPTGTGGVVAPPPVDQTQRVVTRGKAWNLERAIRA
jgi:hypothetical protein